MQYNVLLSMGRCDFLKLHAVNWSHSVRYQWTCSQTLLYDEHCMQHYSNSIQCITTLMHTRQ